MSSLDEITGYQIGYTVLAGLYITPLAVLWFITFCLARREQDPARVGISWLKAVFPVWILGSLLVLIASAVQLWLQFDADISGSTYYAGQRAVEHVYATANFLLQLADIFLFITFVELAGGYMFCLKNPHETSRARRFGRFSILAWSVVLFAMVLSVFALRHSFVVSYPDLYEPNAYDGDDYLAIFNAQVTKLRMEGAVRILLWLTSIPMVGLASLTVHKAKNHQLLHGGSVLFLVTTILDFIRLTINMAIFTQGYLSQLARAVTIGTGIEPAVDLIVEPFFNFTIMFVILVMLFALAIRKANGLWSRPHPEWAYPGMAVVHTVHYPPGQVPVGMVPGQPQYMQQQQPAQGLPAYLQVAQQQQQQQGQGQQGYYYYPQPGQQQPQQMQQQQPQQPQPVYQQQTQEQPKTTENV